MRHLSVRRKFHRQGGRTASEGRWTDPASAPHLQV